MPKHAQRSLVQPHTHLSTVADRIAYTVEEALKQHTTVDICKATGSSKGAVSQWKNKQLKAEALRAGTVLGLARLAKISPYWIWYGEDRTQHWDAGNPEVMEMIAVYAQASEMGRAGMRIATRIAQEEIESRGSIHRRRKGEK